MKKYLTTKNIVLCGIIAGLYFILTIISGPLAFAGGSFQIRISEILNIFVFFNPVLIFGVSLGCLISNIFSMYGILDIIVGTLATILADLIIIFISRHIKNLFAGIICNVLVNTFLVPFAFILVDKTLLTFEFYFLSALWIFVGEVIICLLIGYPLFLFIILKNRKLLKLLGFTQNIDIKW